MRVHVGLELAEGDKEGTWVGPAEGLVEGNIEEECTQVMENLKAVLAAADATFEHVVKTSIFLEDMDYFDAVNKVYGSYFDEEVAPARETVAVRTLPKSVRVEISMVAVKC